MNNPERGSWNDELAATHGLFNNALELAIEESLKLCHVGCVIASMTRVFRTAPVEQLLR